MNLTCCPFAHRAASWRVFPWGWGRESCPFARPDVVEILTRVLRGRGDGNLVSSSGTGTTTKTGTVVRRRRRVQSGESVRFARSGHVLRTACPVGRTPNAPRNEFLASAAGRDSAKTNGTSNGEGVRAVKQPTCRIAAAVSMRCCRRAVGSSLPGAIITAAFSRVNHTGRGEGDVVRAGEQ